MEASRNTDEHRSPTRTNKLEDRSSSHDPDYREPQDKTARRTCPQRNNADKCHRSIHTTSFHFLIASQHKKKRSCQKLSLRRAERASKDTRQSVAALKNTAPSTPDFSSRPTITRTERLTWCDDVVCCAAKSTSQFTFWLHLNREKQRSCQRLSLRRAEWVTKDARQSVATLKNTAPTTPDFSSRSRITHIGWLTWCGHEVCCTAKSAPEITLDSTLPPFFFITFVSNDGMATFFRPLNLASTSKRREGSCLCCVAQHVLPLPQNDQTPRNPAENCFQIGCCRAHLLQPLQLRRRQERPWNPHPTLLIFSAHAVMDHWGDNGVWRNRPPNPGPELHQPFRTSLIRVPLRIDRSPLTEATLPRKGAFRAHSAEIFVWGLVGLRLEQHLHATEAFLAHSTDVSVWGS